MRCEKKRKNVYTKLMIGGGVLAEQFAGAVAELADALDLGSSSFGSAGSIPVSPTMLRSKDLQRLAVSPFFVIGGEGGTISA